MTQIAPNRPRTAISFGGHYSGPTLLVEAGASLCADIVARLGRIASLPRMKGRLVICSDASALTPNQAVDVHMRLTSSVAPHVDILQKATELGMIAGRGVPKRRPDRPGISV